MILWGTLTTSFFYGNPGDYPIMGDWDGDGIETPGMYRQSDGYVYLRNSNTQGIAHIRFFFGDPGDIPIAGDFNGNGFDTVSIYRPSNQTFYIINELGKNDGGLGPADFSYVFGNPGDKPYVGDFNGNGQETVGLHRETTGLVYYRNAHSAGNADNQFLFGDPGDRLVAGDWTARRSVRACVVPSNEYNDVLPLHEQPRKRECPVHSLTYEFDLAASIGQLLVTYENSWWKSRWWFRGMPFVHLDRQWTLTQGNADSQFMWAGAGMNWLRCGVVSAGRAAP